jgi:homoserine O-acetyltransferase
MADPNWNKGFYYDGLPPHTGMKLARRKYISMLLAIKLTHPFLEIATITYRSGPEWDQRFGRKLRELPSTDFPSSEPNKIRIPALCPDFLIETYLDHQGEQFCLKYDANSLIYISKAMDLFDMTLPALEGLGLVPPPPGLSPQSQAAPKKPPRAYPALSAQLSPHPAAHLPSLAAGLSPLANTPTLILGVQSDILFPVEQQREVADALRMTGNDEVRYYELGGVWGHDTFLLDVLNVGGAIRGFLS